MKHIIAAVIILTCIAGAEIPGWAEYFELGTVSGYAPRITYIKFWDSGNSAELDLWYPSPPEDTYYIIATVEDNNITRVVFFT